MYICYVISCFTFIRSPPMPDPLTTLRQMKFRGYADHSAEAALVTICHLTPEQVQQTFQQFKESLAHEAATVDILAGLMLNIHQRQYAMENMIPKLKDEDAPASLFSAHRMLLKDQADTWMFLHKNRKADDRDQCIPPEDVQKEREEARGREERLWELQ